MQIEKIELKKTRNMRDMGGLPTTDGKVIKHGKLIRSGRLSKLPVATVDALVSMNIDNIVDLRTPREIAAHLPTIIGNAEYHYIPLTATMQPELSDSKYMSKEMYAQSKRAKKKLGSYENYMHAMYKFIVFDPDSMQKLKTVFNLFVAEENCLVFHCNSGTDRTGVVAMLLESVLGMDRDTIVEDYMASRRALQRRRNLQKFAMKLVPGFYKLKKLLYAQMVPRPQYITQLMDEIETRYGTVAEYVKKGLGVTDDDIKILKEKYLE